MHITRNCVRASSQFLCNLFEANHFFFVNLLLIGYVGSIGFSLDCLHFATGILFDIIK